MPVYLFVFLLILDALPLATEEENEASMLTNVTTPFISELITSEINKPIESTTAITIESSIKSDTTDLIAVAPVESTVEPVESTVEPVGSTVEPVEETVTTTENIITQTTTETEVISSTVEVTSSTESTTVEVAIPTNNSTPAEVIKDKLSEQIRKILKHYQQPNPEGFPGAPIPDPLSIPPMKKEFGFIDMTFTNMTVHGLSKFKVERVDTDLKKMEVRFL